MSLPPPSDDHSPADLCCLLSLSFPPSLLQGLSYLHAVCQELMSLSITKAKESEVSSGLLHRSQNLADLPPCPGLTHYRNRNSKRWLTRYFKTLLQHSERFLFSDILFLERCLKQKRFPATKMTLIFRKSRTKIMFWLLQRRLPYVVYLNAFRLKHDTIFGPSLTGKNNSKNFLISEPGIL